MSALIASKWYKNGDFEWHAKFGFYMIIDETDSHVTYTQPTKNWSISWPKEHFMQNHTILTDEQKLELL